MPAAAAPRDLFLDRERQAQRSQPAALHRRPAHPHRRSSGAAHCRTPALELAARRHYPRCRLSRPTRRVLTQVVVFGLLAVLCSEVCPGKAGMFSRRQSCRGKSQSPVVRIAEEMETEPSKPIDKISRGEITSHRAVSKENA